MMTVTAAAQGITDLPIGAGQTLREAAGLTPLLPVTQYTITRSTGILKCSNTCKAARIGSFRTPTISTSKAGPWEAQASSSSCFNTPIFLPEASTALASPTGSMWAIQAVRGIKTAMAFATGDPGSQTNCLGSICTAGKKEILPYQPIGKVRTFGNGFL